MITILPAGWLLYVNGSLSIGTFITTIVLSLGIAGPLLAAMDFVDSLATVSYTHLVRPHHGPVYPGHSPDGDEQLHGPDRRSLWREGTAGQREILHSGKQRSAGGGVSKCPLCLWGKGRAPQPVSYTHLDVYKRQDEHRER